MGLAITPSRPVRIPGGQLVTLALAVIVVGGALYLWTGNLSVPVIAVILAASLIFGVTMTLPIGGADMPVVISLLNSFTGTAVAMAGFVLNNPVLIIARRASGAILTKLMADAMNRSVLNILVGGFGGGEGPSRGRSRRLGSRSASTTPRSSSRPRRSSSCPGTAWPSPRPSTRCASWPTSSRARGWT